MKKLLCVIMCVGLIFSLCACTDLNDLSENLTKAGYEVKAMDESRIKGLNNDIKYAYSGVGSVTGGIYAVGENREAVFCVCFADKDDMTLMYKQIKEQLEEGQIIDSSGNILVYGDEKGVKVALK